MPFFVMMKKPRVRQLEMGSKHRFFCKADEEGWALSLAFGAVRFGPGAKSPFITPVNAKVLDAGVTLTPPQIDYDLDKQDTLVIGDQSVNRQTLKVELLL
jgi:hypothetical protein